MDFVLVGTLVILIFAALLQLALALHVRNILVDSAAEGARAGALVGAGDETAVERTRYLIDLALSQRYTHEVSTRRVEVEGMALLQVDVRATIPLLGLVGPTRELEVSGRAVLEDEL